MSSDNGAVPRGDSSEFQDANWPADAAPALSGFLFGNVDAEGRLEADYLDADAKASLHVIAPMVLPDDAEVFTVATARASKNFNDGHGLGADPRASSALGRGVSQVLTSAPLNGDTGLVHAASAAPETEQDRVRPLRSTPSLVQDRSASPENLDFYDASDLSEDLDTSFDSPGFMKPSSSAPQRTLEVVVGASEGALPSAESSEHQHRHGDENAYSLHEQAAREALLSTDYDALSEGDDETGDSKLKVAEPARLGPGTSSAGSERALLSAERAPLQPQPAAKASSPQQNLCSDTDIPRFTRFLVPEELVHPFHATKRKRIRWQSKSTQADDPSERLVGEELLFQRPEDLRWIRFPYAYLILDDMQEVQELLRKTIHRRVLAGRAGESKANTRRCTPLVAEAVTEIASSREGTPATPAHQAVEAPVADAHRSNGRLAAGERTRAAAPCARPHTTSADDTCAAFLWQQWQWEQDVCWEETNKSTTLRYLPASERLEHDAQRNEALVNGAWTQLVAWEGPAPVWQRWRHQLGKKTTSVLELDEHAIAISRRFSWLHLDENDPQLILCRAANRLLTQSAPNLYLPQQLGQIESLLMNASNDRFYGIEMTGQRRRSARTEALANLRHALKARQGYTSAWCYGYTEPQSYYRPNILPILWQLCGQRAVPLLLFAAKSAPSMLPHEMRAWVPKSWSDLSGISPKAGGDIYLFEYPLEADPFLVQLPGMASRLLTYSRRAADDTVSNPSEDPDTVYLAADDLPPLHTGDVRPGQVLRVYENNAFAAPFEPVSPPQTDFLVVCSAQRGLYVRPIKQVLAIGRLEPRNRPKVMIPNSDRMKRFVKNKIELDVTRELIRRGDTGVERSEVIQMFPRRRVYPETTIASVLRETCDNARNRYVIKKNYVETVWPKRELELLRFVTPEETCAFESMEIGWEQLSAKGITIFSSPSMQGNIVGGAEKAGLGARGIEIARYIREELAKTRWVRTEVLVRAQKSLQFALRSVLSAASLAMDILRGNPAADDRLKTMSRDDALRFLKVQFSCNLNPSQRAAIDVAETRAATVRQIALERARQRPLVPLAVQVQRLIDEHVQTVRALSLEHQLVLLREGYPRSATGRPSGSGLNNNIGRKALQRMENSRATNMPKPADDWEERQELSRLLASQRRSVPAPMDSGLSVSGSDRRSEASSAPVQYVRKRRLKIIRRINGQVQVLYLEDPQEIEAYLQHRRMREEALRTGIGGGIGFAARSMTQSRKAGKKGTAEERLRERLEELAEAARRINAWMLGPTTALGAAKPATTMTTTTGAAGAATSASNGASTAQSSHAIAEALSGAVHTIRESIRISGATTNQAVGTLGDTGRLQQRPAAPPATSMRAETGAASMQHHQAGLWLDASASNSTDASWLRVTLPNQQQQQQQQQQQPAGTPPVASFRSVAERDGEASLQEPSQAGFPAAHRKPDTIESGQHGDQIPSVEHSDQQGAFAWLAPDRANALTSDLSQSSSRNASPKPSSLVTNGAGAPSRLKLRIPAALATEAPGLSQGAQLHGTAESTSGVPAPALTSEAPPSSGVPRIFIWAPKDEPEGSLSASTRTSSGFEASTALAKDTTLWVEQGSSPRPGPRVRVSKRSSGKVHLNNILREVETCVRDAEGVVVATTPYISVVRVRPGEALPPGGLDRPAKLAVAGNIDFINPVRDAAYRKKIPLPKQMYLQRIRRKCEEVAYNSVDEFLSDMRQIVENARQYHTAPEAHWVVQHAEYLHEAAEEELKKRQQDIDEAIQRDAQAP